MLCKRVFLSCFGNLISAFSWPVVGKIIGTAYAREQGKKIRCKHVIRSLRGKCQRTFQLFCSSCATYFHAPDGLQCKSTPGDVVYSSKRPMRAVDSIPALRVESNTLRAIVSNPLSHKTKSQTGENNCLYFSPPGRHARLGLLNLMSWRLPVCRIQPRWSIQSEGPGDTLPRGCVCVRARVCVLGCKGEGRGTGSSRECLVMGYQKQSTRGQWDLGHSWHNPNTPGRKWKGGIYWCQRPLALRGGTGASFVPSGVGDGLNRDALHREDASKHIRT